jgi:hypothetical protein
MIKSPAKCEIVGHERGPAVNKLQREEMAPVWASMVARDQERLTNLITIASRHMKHAQVCKNTLEFSMLKS